jgi:GH25 family lysozyme M1 (1,4-beta-N-acetylmuramidase)
MALRRLSNGQTDPSQFLFGIDVSNHNGNMNWSRVKQEGYDFASAKATEGSTFKDPYWDSNHQGMADHMDAYWAYHYVWPNDPAGQARNCRELIGSTDVPVMMDTENMRAYITGEQLRDVIKAFQDEGFTVPLDYLPYWYWSGYMHSCDLTGTPPQVASAYHHNVPDAGWNLAKYVEDSDFAPVGGVNCVIVQCASTGIVANHDNVDIDVYRGTIQELQSLIATKKDDTMTPDKVRKAALNELYKNHREAYETITADVFETPWTTEASKVNPCWELVSMLTDIWKRIVDIEKKLDV